MCTSRPTARPSVPPIWGFGALGWIAVGVLLAIVIAEIATPRGVRFEILRLIEATGGGFAVRYFVAGFLTSAAMTLTTLCFGLVGLLYALPAFAIAPAVRGWLRWWVLPCWTLLDVFVVRSFWMQSVIRAALPGIPTDWRWLLQSAVSLTISVTLLGLCMKKLRPTVIIAALAAVLTAYSNFVPQRSYYINGDLVRSISNHWISLVWPFPFSDISWAAIVFHVGLAFVMIRWAIRERRRATSTTACHACGYSLEGIASNICPECGASAPPLSRAARWERAG